MYTFSPCMLFNVDTGPYDFGCYDRLEFPLTVLFAQGNLDLAWQVHDHNGIWDTFLVSVSMRQSGT